MTDSDEDIFKKVVEDIYDRSRQEILSTPEEELCSKYWYFTFDASKSPEKNIYHFHKMLSIYQRSLRIWEEHHNGHACVVERVRDKYLMPRIAEFWRELSELSS